MMKICVCSECGDPVEVDTEDEWVGVCENCNVYDIDMIGIVEFEDER